MRLLRGRVASDDPFSRDVACRLQPCSRSFSFPSSRTRLRATTKPYVPSLLIASALTARATSKYELQQCPIRPSRLSSSQIASDRGEGGQQQRRAVGSALCLSALLGATDPHLRRRFGLGGWMPSSFVGRAAVLPRVSLVGVVAHISSDLFTEGIYGRSIRAYTDVQGCNLAIASFRGLCSLQVEHLRQY
jgi:hypothetical protein